MERQARRGDGEYPDRCRIRALGVLALVAILGLAGAAAIAAPQPEPEVRIARLHYPGGGDWYCDPSSLPNWLEAFAARTDIRCAETAAIVTLDSEDLYQYPLLYASGHGRIALSDEQLQLLRRYLEAGGFLYVDDNYGLDASFRQLVARLYPDESLQPLSSQHPSIIRFMIWPVCRRYMNTTGNRRRASAYFEAAVW